jgi:hypothetical protein
MRAFATFCLFATLTAASVTAQTSNPTEQAARPGWTFQPSLTFASGWDDNVLLVGVATEQPSDYVNALTPAGSLNYRGRRLNLSTDYQGRFVFYRELSDLNSLDQAGRANLSYRATPYVTVLASHSLWIASETTGVEFVGLPFRRIGNQRNLTTAGVEIRVTPRTTVDASYDLRFVDFDDDVTLAFPGGHEHAFSGELLQQLSSRVAVGGTYGLRRVLIVDDPEPIMLHHAAGIFQYVLSPNVRILGSVGVSHQGAVATSPGQTGLAFRGEINARREHFSVAAYYDRSMLPSFGFGGTFQNEELAGTIQGGFARNRAYWQAGAAWRDSDPLFIGSPAVTPVPATVAATDSSRRTVWLTSRLGYRLAPWLSVEGYYTRAHQNELRPGAKIVRNRFGFQIVTSKPMRIAY